MENEGAVSAANHKGVLDALFPDREERCASDQTSYADSDALFRAGTKCTHRRCLV